MKHKKKLLALLFLLLIVGTIGCEIQDVGLELEEVSEENQAVIDDTPVEGGQITLPLTTFNTLNPLKNKNNSYYHFSKLIFEGLFEFDNDLNVKEQLAESYVIENEGRSIRIKLKDNIYWHDGEKFSAEDVAFTINAIKHGKRESPYGEMLYETLGSYGAFDIGRDINVSIIDSQNIIITFTKGYSNNLEVLTFPIVPRHIFGVGSNERNNYINALRSEDYKVVGTGPYKFKSQDKKKQVILEANELYREGRPYIDIIIGKVIGTEADTLMAFETGQIHIATTAEVDWDKYSKNRRANILEYISSNYEFLGFNHNKDLFQGEDGQGLKRAIAYGIDRQNMIERIYLGHGTQIDVPIYPNSWLISDEANTFGYNLEEARKELMKIGWTEKDEDGILKNSDGERLSLDILTNSYNPTRLTTAELIKKDLLRLGIQVNLIYDRKVEGIGKEGMEEQWQEIEDGLIKGNYDMVLLGWRLSAIPDLSFALHSANISSNTNVVKFSNGEVDQLLERVFFAKTRNEKKQSYKELQNLIVKDLPYISLLFKNQALLVDKKIVGELNPSFVNLYKGIDKAFIPKELQ